MIKIKRKNSAHHQLCKSNNYQIKEILNRKCLVWYFILTEIKESIEYDERELDYQKEPGTFEKEPGINFYNCEI